ncbi:DUF4272 domain-containing protein [Brevibacillus dissolubilis]|uniref:DUF4272 domain-containing protein n=1 Tax=Brevibacillus dissolubilis TaxID=1844116 RepID=UPI0011160C11|nr:DUF4272 domain-containing protein [Brevibacillus dissolubilis]
MKQCTLYVSIKQHQIVTEAIQEAFRGKTIKASPDGRGLTVIEGLFDPSTVTFNTVREDTDSEAFSQMKRGMYVFFYQIETPHNQVKEKLLMQISALNMAVGIVSSKEFDEETFLNILKIANDVHGIVFLPTGEVIDPQGRLIMNPAGESELEDLPIIVSSGRGVDRDGHVEKLEHQTRSQSAEARKERSMELLRAQGIPVIDHLPVIAGDEEAVIRSKNEIVQRAIALCLIAVYAGNLAEDGKIQEGRKVIQAIIQQYWAEGFFTEKEEEFFTDDHLEQTGIIQMAWMYECYWVLLWALGFVEELNFPGQICDVQAAVNTLRHAGNYDGFYRKASVRSKEDILNQADLIYRYHWACVNARVNNQPVPGDLDAGVVMERHRAFNWLIRYMDADWDDVRTDT